MKNKLLFLILIIAFFITACQAESAPAPMPLPAPTEVPSQVPTETPTELPIPTATFVPTETPIVIAAPVSDVFGSVSMADAPMGFSLDPIAAHIFEAELQKMVDVGQIEGYQIESFGIYPRGDGTFFAEIFYAVQADATFWVEDFGSAGDDGWVRGKCTLFDFVTTEEEFQLKNKKVCS
ncbi:MAG: hypothetical protein HN390_01910 [Anaerolineae bacterium]|jgi:hypothetical protein|nr:hypothetical protein [Anaerolineae bacterium]MBT7189078.1 hypothetical protein [Anaerolineae bacterium]MBT7990351.1 hypothetical protein [Anaerolineae bacterium]